MRTKTILIAAALVAGAALPTASFAAGSAIDFVLPPPIWYRLPPAFRPEPMPKAEPFRFPDRLPVERFLRLDPTITAKPLKPL